MQEFWQFAGNLGSLGDWAQVAAAVFVGVSLVQSTRSRELDVFMRLNERWDALGDICRREGIPAKPQEERAAWVQMLMSFGELLACVYNSGQLSHWRLRLHFSNAIELVEEWMQKDMPDEARDPTFLPEFKEMLRRQRAGK